MSSLEEILDMCLTHDDNRMHAIRFQNTQQGIDFDPMSLCIFCHLMRGLVRVLLDNLFLFLFDGNFPSTTETE